MAASPVVACFAAHPHPNPLFNRRATSQTHHLQARMPLLKKSAKHSAALANPWFIMFAKSCIPSFMYPDPHIPMPRAHGSRLVL